MSVSVVRCDSYEPRNVQESLRKALVLLGFDRDRPFETLVKPGDQVFIKPNWVAHRYRASCPKQYDVFTTITHPTVIRAVAGFVDQILNGNGRIIIGDNPSIDADFKKLMQIQNLDSLFHELKTPLEILDLRPLVCEDLKDYGHRDRMKVQTGDPRGETTINLGQKSMLFGLKPRLFRGVFTDRDETIRAHTGETQLYSFSNSIYKSDVYISVPKLKTHHKCGVTLNLKGLVGTVGIKNYLVHWREGFPGIGGDAYPSFFLWLKDFFRKVKKRGAWQGNDTIWRMVVDLYSGIQNGPKKRFSVVDGIMAGQGDGPFCPEPKEASVLLAGTDFLETDWVAARLMGFSVEKIHYLNYFMKNMGFAPEQVSVRSDFFDCQTLFDSSKVHLDFKPPSCWSGMKKEYHKPWEEHDEKRVKGSSPRS